MRKENVLFIVNPAAGYNTGRKTYKAVYESLKKHFKNLNCVLSRSPGEIEEIAGENANKGYDLFISLGGDGTAFEVLNGIMNSNTKKRPQLSFIPSGSGNSFLRDFNVTTQEEAINRIVNGKIKKIDIIKCKYTNKDGDGKNILYYLNIMGTGFVTRVASMRLKYFRHFREFGYTIGVLLQLIPLKRDDVVLNADGNEYNLKNNFISVCNSKYTGGKMMMAPKAELDDGKMDVIMLNDAGRVKMLKSFPKIFDGSHLDIDNVKMIQAKRIKISSGEPLELLVDGEVKGNTPLEAEVLPRYLEILI